MGTQFEHLLRPITLGPFTLPNRIIVTAHTTAYSNDGLIGDQEIAYQARKAAGGFPLLTTGSTAVHPSGGAPQMRLLTNFGDEVLPGYRRLAAAVHGHGGRMLVQLTHLASTFTSHHAGSPLWAPSRIVGEYAREAPHVMSVSEIETVLDAFQQAARRVRAGGLDGVELQAFSGSLAVQFLSEYTNKRDDAYGGSLENRLRFPLKMVRTCREALGDDRLLGLKIAGDELVSGGLRLPDVLEIIQRIDAVGMIDYYVVATGNNLDRFARIDHWPPTPAPHNLHAGLAAAIRRVVTRPVAALARIVDVTEADALIRDGTCDLVAMVRASIADPDLPAKATTGRASEIRPCVGDSTACIDRIIDGHPMRCIYNPVIGRERTLGRPRPLTTSSLRVTVIGGGPAGLEAARVAAEAGHQVRLFERSPDLGGMISLVVRQPGRAELGGISAWLAGQVRQLGVAVHLAAEATPDIVLADAPDAIIVATGAMPQLPALRPTASIRVASAVEVLRGEHQLAGPVLVIDNTGSQVGCAVAELAADHGFPAEVVTRHFYAALDFGLTNTVSLYRRLFTKGVEFTPHHDLSRITDATVTLENVYSRRECHRTGVETVVVVTESVPRDRLLDVLDKSAPSVIAIGDCLAPRDIETAVFEGHRAALSLGGSA